jgi:hypothetical protein
MKPTVLNIFNELREITEKELVVIGRTVYEQIGNNNGKIEIVFFKKQKGTK